MSWQGYYVQCEKQHLMNFQNFNANPTPGGMITGHGEDTVGQFDITGSFSSGTALPECKFVKQYRGKHAIYYFGTADIQTATIKGWWGFHPGEKEAQFLIRRA